MSTAPTLKPARPAANPAFQFRWSNYLFILPAFLMFLTFSMYPFYKVAQLSFFDWDGIAPAMTFVGLRNFVEILLHDHVWWNAFGNAAWVTLMALVLQNALALGLAMAVSRELRGGSAYRVIFFLPPVLSGIIVGLMWGWIYDGNFGILNQMLNVVGLGHLGRAWLADPNTALAAVAVVHMWKGFGWGFIILLAGLQNIPQELYEAAKVDGAGPWERFVNITVPMMIPVFFLVSILTILGTMQIFDIIVSTTNGGPGYHTEVPVTRVYHAMIASSRFGYACALGLVFGAILLVISRLQMRISKRVERIF